MDLHIFLSSDNQYMLKADGYDYKALPDFKKYGTGYLETEKEYSTFEFLKYECELLKTNVSSPHRFWTSKRYTKVWLIEKDERRELPIEELVGIGDRYHVLHVSAKLMSFTIKNYGHKNKLYIRHIYLEEN